MLHLNLKILFSVQTPPSVSLLCTDKGAARKTWCVSAKSDLKTFSVIGIESLPAIQCKEISTL